jgi:hypothetical protein
LTLSLLTLSLLTLSLLTLSLLTLSLLTLSLLTLSLLSLVAWVSLPFARLLLPVFLPVTSSLRHAASLFACGCLVRFVSTGSRISRLHPAGIFTSSLPTMLENPLHRLAVVGAVGSHRRSRLLLAVALFAFALLAFALSALRLPGRTTSSRIPLPRLVIAGLFARGSLAVLLSISTLLAVTLLAVTLLAITLLAIRLVAATPIPLCTAALSGPAGPS